jgi:hypothetical protein
MGLFHRSMCRGLAALLSLGLFFRQIRIQVRAPDNILHEVSTDIVTPF